MTIETIKIPHKNDISGLLQFRKDQSKAYRIAYKMAARGIGEKEIRRFIKDNRDVGLADSWLVQSAIRSAIGAIKAEIALDKLNGTSKLGKRIFGGKKNFFARLKGKITKEEFQAKRLENFRSIGEAPPCGNRKVEFNHSSIVIKPARGTKVQIDLPSLKPNWRKIYDKIIELTVERKIPITVEVNDKFIYLTYDADLVKSEQTVHKFIVGRHLGIDLNPNYIGVSFFSANQELLDTKLYSLKNLTGKNINQDKLRHEIREIAIQIGRLSQHYQIEWSFVEDLKFRQGNKKKGKNFNRLCGNQFLHNEFIRMLSKYSKVKAVNAAYSSTIGNILHHDFPDPIAASMEIARRGIESRIVKGSRRFYPPMVSNETLQNLWKKEEVPMLKTWIELHNWLKETGMKYRGSLPEIDLFRLFNRSESSRVLVHNLY